jgi:hypothetical protein
MFIGDNDMREEKALSDSYFDGKLLTEWISTSGGLIPTLSQIDARLQQLQKLEGRRNFYLRPS